MSRLYSKFQFQISNFELILQVNFFPSAPWHYRELLERYAESFSGAKEKEFVRYKLRKRLRAFVSSLGPISKDLRDDWAKATGFSIRNCYTTMEAGTVLSEPVGDGPQVRRIVLTKTPDGGVEAKSEVEDPTESADGKKTTMDPMPGVSTRIVRFVGEKNIKQEVLDQDGTNPNRCTGQLMVRTAGLGR